MSSKVWNVTPNLPRDFRPGSAFTIQADFASALPSLKDRELRCLIALACLAVGMQTTCLRQIDIGAAAGLQRRPTQRALKALQARGLINRCTRMSKDHQPLPTQYQLCHSFKLPA